MDIPIFIHVGFPKTGTTWLQKYIFSQHPEIGFIGKPTPKINDPRLFNLKREILNSTEDKFDPKKIRGKFATLFKEVQNSKTKILGMSIEAFTKYNEFFKTGDYSVANKLAEIFENDAVKIIIGIRNQVNMIASYYSQFVKGGETLSLEQVLFSPCSNRSESFMKTLKFDQTVKQYEKNFGVENISIYLQEFLKDRQSHLIKKLTDFLEISICNSPKKQKRANPKLSAPAQFFMRTFVNPVFLSGYSPISPFNPLNMVLKPLIYLLEKFDSQKKLLERKIDSDYSKSYKYHLESAIHKKIQNTIFKTVRGIDQISLIQIPIFKYEMNYELKIFINSYYAPSNKKLNATFSLPFKDYNYPL